MFFSQIRRFPDVLFLRHVHNVLYAATDCLICHLNSNFIATTSCEIPFPEKWHSKPVPHTFERNFRPPAIGTCGIIYKIIYSYNVCSSHLIKLLHVLYIFMFIFFILISVVIWWHTCTCIGKSCGGGSIPPEMPPFFVIFMQKWGSNSLKPPFQNCWIHPWASSSGLVIHKGFLKIDSVMTFCHIVRIMWLSSVTIVGYCSVCLHLK